MGLTTFQQLLLHPPMPHNVTVGGGMEKFGRTHLRGGEFVWGKVKGHGYWPGKVAAPAQVRRGCPAALRSAIVPAPYTQCVSEASYVCMRVRATIVPREIRNLFIAAYGGFGCR
jgi:hypothetical protein